MSTPGFLESAGAGLALSLAGTLAASVMAWVLPGGAALRLALAAVGIGALLHLAARAPGRGGRVTAILIWTALAAVLAAAGVPLAAYALALGLLLGLARAFLQRRRPLAATLDLGLAGLGLAAGAAALGHTGSLLLALWCFFLVQALSALLPVPAPGRAEGGFAERFGRARRAAAGALGDHP